MDQIKNALIDNIRLIEDKGIINELSRVLADLSSQPIQKLKKEEKELVMMGLKDLRNGRITTDEELRKEEDAWLNG